MSKRYITPAGYRRLQAELDSLWANVRPRIVEEVAVAAAHGDRSENAEYIYGKKKLREVDRRIRHLAKLLDRLTVVERDGAQPGRVFFGATVTLEDEDGARFEYRIVGPDEIDLKRGWISVESPMARALLGRKAGEEVEVRRPAGEVFVTLISVEYEPRP